MQKQYENEFFFSYLKIFISPANEFLLHKCRKKKNKNMKKKIFTSPANEFLLHRIEWKNAPVLLMSFSYMHVDRRTYIYPPLDKRYSTIISTICGQNPLNILWHNKNKMALIKSPRNNNCYSLYDCWNLNEE